VKPQGQRPTGSFQFSLFGAMAARNNVRDAALPGPELPVQDAGA
jgi:hypothetical protein